MKFLAALGACALGIGVAVTLLSAGAEGGISNSDHDFSSESWNTDGVLCEVCHTPHDASSTAGPPLWDHDETSAVFTVYSSPTMDATVGQPTGVSKLCLGCHDGTIAIDAFGSHTGGVFITGDAKLGIDLSGDHPISFTYDSTLVTNDGNLHAPASIGLPLFGTSGDQMECASCHDPHDDTNGGFLRISNSGSALCLRCHDM